MKKMRLQLDALSVETFAVDAALARSRGTVKGHDTYGGGMCGGDSGFINYCVTWDQFDSRCVDSDFAGCSPVCPSGHGVCHSVPEGCFTGVRCETSVENCGA